MQTIASCCPPREAKGKKKARVVYLVEDAKAIVRSLVKSIPFGPLFRNTDGKPWTRFAVNCAFCRLQIVTGKQRMKELGVEPSEKDIKALMPKLKQSATFHGVFRAKRPAELHEEAKRKLTNKMAQKHANKCCAYLFRHSFADHALRNGVDPMTVSVLLGHADVSTLGKVYQHLSQSPDYLKEAAKRARAS